MNDDRLLITDGVHTENTEENGGPQADFVGESESSEFKRNLNGGPQADDGGEQGLIIRTSFILSGAHQATQVFDD